jgi:hypothetical protein
MKIALCISGLGRTFGECYPTLIQNVINTNPQHEFDVIASFSNKQGISIEYNDSAYKFKTVEYCVDPILEDITYQKNKYTYAPTKDHPCIPSCYYQLMGLKRVNQLRKSVEETHHIEYELLARIRPDVKFLTPVDLSNISTNKIYIPNSHDYFGYNDRFAIGTPEVMNIYFNRYDFWMSNNDNIVDYTTHAESNLKVYLSKENIIVDRLNFKYCFRRPGNDAEHGG